MKTSGRAARGRLLPALAFSLLIPGALAPPIAAEPAGFDFYVLALSWSPSYCAAEGADANRMQCGAGGGYGFIVHGLWPQFERGYPEFCETVWPERVPGALGEAYFDIMPGMGLIGHQWRKHGSCTGLSPTDYLATTRDAFERVAIPDELARGAGSVDAANVERSFIAANPGLSGDAMAVSCDGALMREVRICMTVDLDFRPCPEVDARGCMRSGLEMPPR